MKALLYPEDDFLYYYIKKEFPDKYCCYIYPDQDGLSDYWDFYWKKFIEDLGIEYTDFVSMEVILLEFETEEEMIRFVNTYPEQYGYCLGYSKGKVSTENT